MSAPVVIIMAKAPRAGEVKTRLVPPLTPTEAASLAAAFVRDVFKVAADIVGECVIAYSPASGRATFAELLAPRADLHWIEQGEGDLGARLERVAARASADGFGPLIFLGTDSPTLPPSLIEKARAALDEGGDADLALGPTDDGGYYLVALRRPVAGLFQNVAWSTPRAFEQTAANAARLGLRLCKLSRWYDVDTPADLVRLREELFRDEAARRRAPATHAWLRAHAHLFAG